MKQRRVQYNAKDRELKRRAREDKRNWTEEKAAEAAEKVAENGTSKELCSITKVITGERERQTVGVKDKPLGA